MSGVALILYTKQDCPLCDGLKDKINALLARAQFMPCSLSGGTLEVRDIADNEEWAAAHAGSVPVLTLVTQTGTEVPLPRPQPRIPADRLQRHLETAIAELK